MIEQTNRLLQRFPIGAEPPVICLLTGSSGCGKTHLSEVLSSRLDLKRAAVHHFDSIGVPSADQMVEQFGSGEKWQEATTHQWLDRLAAIRDKALITFEGQYHPRFAIEACERLGLKNYALALVSCNEDVWTARLRGPRQQGELVTPAMRNWARVLHDETLRLGGTVIDTSESNVQRNVEQVAQLVNPLLRAGT